MIDTVCTCGQPATLPESAVPATRPCPACNASHHFVTAESLPDGAGAGDFDACLVVERGPHNDRVGHVYYLGGVPPLHLGKLSTSHILLPGSNVSRHHATLSRQDFGPSRWQIEDHNSTNGLWINDQRVTAPHDLQDDDLIVIGDYELRYRHAPDPQPVMAAAGKLPLGAAKPGAGPGRSCPSCSRTLAANAKICVDCGIFIDTGKPLLTSKGFDEDELYIKAENTIRVISWIAPTGLYPIASEGFGTRKPYVLWALVIFTIFTSIVAFIADAGVNEMEELVPSANYMLWAGNPDVSLVTKEDLAELSEADQKEVLAILANRPVGQYRHHQLLTHAFLHGDFFHLAGNMLFMIVLGVSVNSLLGNAKMIIIYPLLAVAGAVGHILASRDEPLIPMVGASGAIMGLAGMYLVLFPVHKMYMAAWIRWGIFAGFKLSWKVWALRGFWVVLFYISFDILYTTFGIKDSTAHWAHLGGFIGGIVVALFLLLTRLVNARGGDLLSVTLGRHAWKLLGKPASRKPEALPEPVASPVVATPMNYPQ